MHDGRRRLDDCWNRIGVEMQGDASCPQLEQYAHCRNCPAYSAAAMGALDREPPAGYLAAWTGHFADAKPRVAAAETHSLLVFRLGSEWFALPTEVIDEIAEERAIHSLPHRRSGIVLGLVNVRGELLICVSLVKLLGLSSPAPEPGLDAMARRRLVVIRRDGKRLAFPVDEVQTVHRYRLLELQAVPATITKAAASFTRAMLPWLRRSVGCLDEQLVIAALNRSLA
jgi:chemotaxis-related protein WspD